MTWRGHRHLFARIALTALASAAPACLLTATPEELLSGGYRDAGRSADAGSTDATTGDQRLVDRAGQDRVQDDTHGADAFVADVEVADRATSDVDTNDVESADQAPGVDSMPGVDRAVADSAVADSTAADSARVDANPGDAGAPLPLSCASSSTLEALVACIVSHMPRSGTGYFVAPSTAERSAWVNEVGNMLGGTCSPALPAALRDVAERFTLVDTDNSKSYCGLVEAGDANGNGWFDRGWGAVVVDPNATRELSHQAPHPLADLTTESQAVTIFKRTASRSFVLAGAHRDASSVTSACQSAYTISDVTHNANTMFQAAVEALLAHYAASPFTVIQWHGMGTSCTTIDVFLSHGSSSALNGDAISVLRTNTIAAHPGWLVETPLTDSCSLAATTNVQGRLLNGVPAAQVCATAASTYSQRFISAEQHSNFRAPLDWVVPVEATWP